MNKHFVKQIKDIENQKELYLNLVNHNPNKPHTLSIAKQMARFDTKIRKIKEQETKMFRSCLRNMFKKYIKLHNGVKVRNKKINRKIDLDEIEIRKKCRAALSIRQNDICAICGTKMGDDITYEHIIPVSRNGKTSLDNGKAVHKWCNQYLGTLSLERKRNMFIE